MAGTRRVAYWASATASKPSDHGPTIAGLASTGLESLRAPQADPPVQTR